MAADIPVRFGGRAELQAMSATTAGDGARIHFEVVGDGEPLLLLAGQANSRHWWDPVRPELAARYRTIALDALGTGDSDAPATGYGTRRGHFQKNFPPSKLKMLPHNRPRCTGITGTSRPSVIFSRPRLNGSKLPVRLMAPSAKMHTTWPFCSSCRALRIDATTSLGPLVPTGIARARRRNQLSDFIS